MWEGAKPIAQYFANCPKYREKSFFAFRNSLRVVGYYRAEYGDWTLYRDGDGNLWEEYTPIGD